ncbi:MAG: TonB-dependent receptor, partial [Prevotellaceae bacterium]|nr:TonB-dependent receptor [Prevotellaceae bacterium]
ASLFWQWYPFAGNLLRLRLYAEVFHQTATLDDASWHHTGYVVIPSLYIAYKRWGFQVIYQTQRKTLTGQTLKNTPSMASVELTYNPAKHLTLTAGIRYPFYNAWKQTTSVYGTALLSRAETERIKNNANMVYVNLVYNLPFGKSGAAAKRKMENADKDSGILNR